MKSYDIFITAVFGIIIGWWMTSNYYTRQIPIIKQGVGGMEHPIIIDLPNYEPEKKAFIAPLNNYKVTSVQGIRKSPVTGKKSIHYGIDLSIYNWQDRYVMAIADGVVINHYPPPDGYHKGHPTYGGFIEIKHADGISRYGHFEKTFVHEGDVIKQGQIIGEMGDTGLSFGKHLHFEYIEVTPWTE